MSTVKELKLYQNWIKALRSGDYRQGENALAANNFYGDLCYCCLGVLCDISDDMEPRRNALGEQAGFLYKKSEACDSYLPTVPPDEKTLFNYIVYRKDMPDGLVPNTGATSFQSYIADANDAGMSFSEIADFLESIEDDFINYLENEDA